MTDIKEQELINQFLSTEELDALTDQTAGVEISERQLPPAGSAIAVLVSAIDLGKHPKNYNGKITQTNKIVLQFELQGKNYAINDSEGNYIGQHIVSEYLWKGTTNNARFVKLVKKLGAFWKRDHVAKLIGCYWRTTISHRVVPDAAGGTPKTYVSMRDSAGETILQDPVKYDEDGAVEGVIKVQPSEHRQYRLFLWDTPNQQQWDSLFIDGTRTDKDGVEHSKNWIQDTIRKATNFNGSPIFLLTGGVQLDAAGKIESAGEYDPDDLS